MTHLARLAVPLTVMALGGFARRNEPSHFKYPITGRWWKWWLLALVVDLFVIAGSVLL